MQSAFPALPHWPGSTCASLPRQCRLSVCSPGITVDKQRCRLSASLIDALNFLYHNSGMLGLTTRDVSPPRAVPTLLFTPSNEPDLPNHGDAVVALCKASLVHCLHGGCSRLLSDNFSNIMLYNLNFLYCCSLLHCAFSIFSLVI